MIDLTHLSLFSGIGGLDLAAESAGFRTVGQCEWADYPTRILAKHWPDVPRWRDIRNLTKENFYEQTGLHTVTVVSGGFPCQPFSVAGKRRGNQDDRYLWPEMLRIIEQLRPTWVVGENVAGIVSLALDTVLSDLEGLGYAGRAFVIPACAVDAPHRRDRVAIVANRERAVAVSNANCVRLWPDSHISDNDKKRNNQAQGKDRQTELCKAGRGSGSVSDTEGKGLQRHRKSAPQSTGKSEQRQFAAEDRPSWYEWWDTEPDVGRVADGIPNRVDRIKALGNAVVPQQFAPIFRAIAQVQQLFTRETSGEEVEYVAN